MMQRLVTLDKQLGVCPVGIGEVWQQLLAKLVVKQAGELAKFACRSLQLWAGLEADIRGTLQAVWKWAAAEAKMEGGSQTQENEASVLLRAASLRMVIIGDTAPLNDLMARTTDLLKLNSREGFTMVNVANGFNKLC